jgi:hypothetical protein
MSALFSDRRIELVVERIRDGIRQGGSSLCVHRSHGAVVRADDGLSSKDAAAAAPSQRASMKYGRSPRSN